MARGAYLVKLAGARTHGVPLADQMSLLLQATQQRVKRVRVGVEAAVLKLFKQAVSVAGLRKQPQAGQHHRASPQFLQVRFPRFQGIHASHVTVCHTLLPHVHPCFRHQPLEGTERTLISRETPSTVANVDANVQDGGMELPTLDDVLAGMRVVQVPLATRFRGVDYREASLIEGPAGWGEFAPFLEYDDAESSTWLAAALNFAYAAQPTPLRTRVRVNATIPAITADRVASTLARFDGCRTAKVKVAEQGQQLADDIERVRAVREQLGPEGRVRIDANGAWSLDEAERAIHALAEFDLEYVEQPCLQIEELAELRRRIRYLGIPIAADESVRKASDPLAVARAGAADILVIKAAPLGGVRRALQLAEDAGLPVVVSSALETSVGLSMGATLAAALPRLDYDCGLGTASLLAADVCATPLRPIAGEVHVARVTPQPILMNVVRADAARTEWWRARVTRCHAMLAASSSAS